MPVTFAEGAVWSAEVHQAGNFGRVAQVGHHRLLSVMNRLICRGGRGVNNAVSLGNIANHAFNDKSKKTLKWHKRSLCAKNGKARWIELHSTISMEASTRKSYGFIDRRVSHPAAAGGSVPPWRHSVFTVHW